jgi:predicted RNA-binding protein with PIN domain
MAYLIDGNNLLGALFPGYHRDPENKRKLVRRLISFQRSTRARLILVFDGAASADAEAMAASQDRFAVVHPPPGESADAAIREIIAGLSDLRKLFVVSSDREIRSFARLKGAVPMTSREFKTELNRALRTRKMEKEMEKNEPGPTSLEVRLWSQVFKENK